MITYKDAGVDVEAGYEAVRRMRRHVDRTMRPEVLSGIGGFGGLFSLADQKCAEPVLVSGTDGVGTKLKIAFLMNRHDTVGIDCVAMCVNDIVCSGAEPLFFLDYIALGKNIPEKVATIVKGVADGCVEAGCALIGGETAEMPGFYPEDEYDLAGFAVGIVDRNRIIDGSGIHPGDSLIGISSSGLHSNGFSLVRKLLGPDPNGLTSQVPELGKTLAEELLTPTRIYVKTVRSLIAAFPVKGIAHITGGGFIENIPRMLPKGLKACIRKGSWEILPIFHYLKDLGQMDDQAVYNTFNMGIGLVLTVSSDIAGDIAEFLKNHGEKAWIIGNVTEGDDGICLC